MADPGKVIQTLRQSGFKTNFSRPFRPQFGLKLRGEGGERSGIRQDRLGQVIILRHLHNSSYHTKAKSINSYIHNQHVSIVNKIVMLHRFLSGPQQFQDMKLCLFQEIFFKQQLLSCYPNPMFSGIFPAISSLHKISNLPQNATSNQICKTSNLENINMLGSLPFL